VGSCEHSNEPLGSIKVKGKVAALTEHHTMVYWGSGGIAPCVDLSTQWR
jgi:hypothetical protein